MPDVPGVYRFRVVVSDGCSDSSAEMEVEAVCAELPSVDAGEDMEIVWATAGAVALDGINGTAGTVTAAGNISADGLLPEVGGASAAGVVVRLHGSVGDDGSADGINPQNMSMGINASSSDYSGNGSVIAVRWEFIRVPYADSDEDSVPAGLGGLENATGGVFSLSVGAMGVPQIYNATTLLPWFVARRTGTYSLALVATDGCASVRDVVHVHVLCAAPQTNPVSATGGLRSRIADATARSAAGGASPAPTPPVHLQSATVPVGAWVDLAGVFDYAAYLGGHSADFGGVWPGPFGDGPSSRDEGGSPAAGFPSLPQLQFDWTISEEAPYLDTGGSYLVPIA